MTRSYFDELEAELRRAVPAAATRRGAVWRWGRQRRPRPGALGAVISVAVTVAVALLALTLVHARSSTRSPTPAVRLHRPFHLPAGEQLYPLAAVPTRTQLLANFAVLRRAQNNADRSWRPNCGCGDAAHQFFGLTRYARTLSDGHRVFLDVEQFIAPGQLNFPADSYVLNFDLVGPHGQTNSAAFGPNTGYSVFPIPSQGPDNTAGVPATNDWVSVIPDGVSTVRWTFACQRGPQRPCTPGGSTVYTIRVVHNVAAAIIPHSGNCSGCAAPTVVQWLNAHGNVVASFHRATNLPAPPFVTGRRGTGTLNVLRADGIANARIGQPSTQAITALNALLGPVAQSNVTTHGCGVDHESIWSSPTVSEPLTIYQHAGRLVGYSYGAPASEIGLSTGPGATLRTTAGLTVGDTIAHAHALYGDHLSTRVSGRSGLWTVQTDNGEISGAVLPIRYPLRSVTARNPIVIVTAGDTGCLTHLSARR